MKRLLTIILVIGVAADVIAIRGQPAGTNTTRSGDRSGQGVSRLRKWEWKGQVEPGGSLEIKGVQGNITVVGVAGPEAEATAEIYDKGRDPQDVQIIVRQRGPDVTICTVYPAIRDQGQSPDDVCRPGPHGLPQSEASEVAVDFTARLPAGARFVGRAVNGDIFVEGTIAYAEAHTVNGDVTVATTGLAQAGTVNGSIHASLGRESWDGSVSFTTVNGSVLIELPPALAADVNLSTVAGRVSIEFPVTVSGRWSPRHLRGTVGDGGGILVAKSVQGNVEIRRR